MFANTQKNTTNKFNIDNNSSNGTSIEKKKKQLNSSYSEDKKFKNLT